MKHNRKFRKRYWQVLYMTGLLIFSVSSMLRHKLSDFQLGFCEGISIVLILVGFVLVCSSLLRKENPFRL